MSTAIRELPIIDVAPLFTASGRSEVAEQISRACREQGFSMSSGMALTRHWFSALKP